MTTLRWPAKDADEVLDFHVSWRVRANLDPIMVSTFEIVSGDGQLSIDSTEIDNLNERTTAWLSGGTTGTTYNILNRITTNNDRTMDCTARLKVRSK